MSKNIHVKKFMNGRFTPKEVHAHYAWHDAKCVCGGPAFVRCVSFAPIDEMKKRAEPMLVKLAMDNEGRIPMIRFNTPGNEQHGEKFVKIGSAFACVRCKSTLEREAAKGPSWVLHEWDYGPKETTQVQSAGLPS